MNGLTTMEAAWLDEFSALHALHELHLESSSSHKLGQFCTLAETPPPYTTTALTAQLHVLLDDARLDVVVLVLRHDHEIALDRPLRALSPRRDLRCGQV